ncbi:hypothetical protein [Pseudomonas sp. PDM31]|uniref:hypothetical protein n=1 Tax=Pseudomonas sp. PDM31 TaxID=2854778 RepID=UPI001C477FA9|nr:hypothetical protein [Pseudomonas sp. PDM31]MBV7479911.1 hypothetical protein [Pseudomonas sp. PDM31]
MIDEDNAYKTDTPMMSCACTGMPKRSKLLMTIIQTTAAASCFLSAHPPVDSCRLRTNAGKSKCNSMFSFNNIHDGNFQLYYGASVEFI